VPTRLSKLERCVEWIFDGQWSPTCTARASRSSRDPADNRLPAKWPHVCVSDLENSPCVIGRPLHGSQQHFVRAGPSRDCDIPLYGPQLVLSLPSPLPLLLLPCAAPACSSSDAMTGGGGRMDCCEDEEVKVMVVEGSRHDCIRPRMASPLAR
jgi:hypothetical protein